MERMGIQTAILSVTAPGACIVDDQQQQQSLARNLNDFAANIRNEDLNSFGFFASLPDIRNTTAAVEDISYALDQLHADGVTLFTRYGPGNAYLGHPDLEPVWEELNRRRAVVFVHPTQPVDTNLVNPKLLQPMIDYPHETTRTAMDMIMSRTLQKFPNVKVILSHAGGNLPYVITRLSTPLRKTPDVAARWKTGTQYDDVVESFRKFYYDVALSSAPQVLRTLFDTVPHDHILFGVSTSNSPQLQVLRGNGPGLTNKRGNRAIFRMRPRQHIRHSLKTWKIPSCPESTAKASTTGMRRCFFRV